MVDEGEMDRLSPPGRAAAARPSAWVSFGRSQIASFVATAVDFGTLVFLVEVAHVYYVAANAIGAALGALTNFLIGRHWSFEAGYGRIHHQALRYAIVSAMSLCLNSLGVYLLTEWAGFHYPVSKVIASLLVGFCFNFPLHRSFVFR